MSYGDDHDDTRDRGIPSQTRTHLPEEPEPSTRRQPASPGRSIAAIVGVVVLLLAAIVVANQAGDDAGTPSDGSDSGGQAQALAPTGEQPVDTSTNGVPTGFAHSEQGAQSAAANYAVLLGGDGMFDRTRRQGIVSTVYAARAAAEQAADLDEAYSDPAFLERVGLTESGTAPAGMTFVSRVTPVGARVLTYTEEKARVAVWHSSLFGLAGEESANPVTESWYTTTYDLVWDGSDWKVTDFEQEDGPVPVARDQRASTAEEMADAVEQYGGFTYAR